tara:strand:- start:302 stop:517 length:216 start_codon:yes stop_codon:yes gene_type:complete
VPGAGARRHGLELGQVQDDIGTDHESCHGVFIEAWFGERSAAAIAWRVVVVDRSLDVRLRHGRSWCNGEHG